MIIKVTLSVMGDTKLNVDRSTMEALQLQGTVQPVNLDWSKKKNFSIWFFSVGVTAGAHGNAGMSYTASVDRRFATLTMIPFAKATACLGFG